MCTADEVRTKLGLTPVELPDAEIEPILDSVSARLLRFSHVRDFRFQAYEEILKGGGGPELMVTRVPIVGVILVELVFFSPDFSTATFTDFTSETFVEDARAGFLFRRFGFQSRPWSTSALGLVLTELGDPIPGTEEPNWRITYEAGYTMPEQSGPSATGGLPDNQVGIPLEAFPLDLRAGACAQAVEDWLRRKRSGDVKKKRIRETDIEFFSNSDRALAEQFGLGATAFYAFNPIRRAA